MPGVQARAAVRRRDDEPRQGTRRKDRRGVPGQLNEVGSLLMKSAFRLNENGCFAA